MRNGNLTRSFDPAKAVPWTGPQPWASQMLLLSACLDRREQALVAWRTWLAGCDFEHENPASFELAALAVARLGAVAGDDDRVRRCRGWARRSWLIGRLAEQTVARLDRVCQEMGVEALAVGDLATWQLLGGSGRGWLPPRSLELLVPYARQDLVGDLLRVAREGPGAEAIRTRSLGLAIGPDVAWPCRWMLVEGPRRRPGIQTPPLVEHLAALAGRNWLPNPPGRLRWILELRALAGNPFRSVELTNLVRTAGERMEVGAGVADALEFCARLPGGDNLACGEPCALV